MPCSICSEEGHNAKTGPIAKGAAGTRVADENAGLGTRRSRNLGPHHSEEQEPPAKVPKEVPKKEDKQQVEETSNGDFKLILTQLMGKMDDMNTKIDARQAASETKFATATLKDDMQHLCEGFDELKIDGLKETVEQIINAPPAHVPAWPPGRAAWAHPAGVAEKAAKELDRRSRTVIFGKLPQDEDSSYCTAYRRGHEGRCRHRGEVRIWTELCQARRGTLQDEGAHVGVYDGG